MNLHHLHDKFIAEGYTNFYIDGIGGPMSDDVHRLGFDSESWTVYYVERGIKSKPIFSTKDKDVAIAYYSDFVAKIEHWHLVVFTRSTEIFNDFLHKLQKLKVECIQNDIPNYAVTGDTVHRLFVVNKDIFAAKAKIDGIPYFDKDLQR